MIGLLNAYHFKKESEPYQLEYGPMFLNFLKMVMPDRAVRTYHVGLGELPQSVSECEGWILTGSSKSAYDTDTWIQNLGSFIQKIDREKKKLIGVCFGHQLVAQYLGGRTEKAASGWGVGVRSFDIIKSKEWMRPELKKCSLLFSHQDQVIELPEGAELLARDHFCPNQMYSLGSHIFCFQGHPEFTSAFAKARYDSRINLLGAETHARAVASLQLPTHALEVGKWMNRFLD